MGKTPMQGAQVWPLIEELISYMLAVLSSQIKKKRERERLNAIYNYLLKVFKVLFSWGVEF